MASGSLKTSKRAVKWIQYSTEAYRFEPNNNSVRVLLQKTESRLVFMWRLVTAKRLTAEPPARSLELFLLSATGSVAISASAIRLNCHRPEYGGYFRWQLCLSWWYICHFRFGLLHCAVFWDFFISSGTKAILFCIGLQLVKNLMTKSAHFHNERCGIDDHDV